MTCTAQKAVLILHWWNLHSSKAVFILCWWNLHRAFILHRWNLRSSAKAVLILHRRNLHSSKGCVHLHCYLLSSKAVFILYWWNLHSSKAFILQRWNLPHSSKAVFTHWWNLPHSSNWGCVYSALVKLAAQLQLRLCLFCTGETCRTAPRLCSLCRPHRWNLHSSKARVHSPCTCELVYTSSDKPSGDSHCYPQSEREDSSSRSAAGRMGREEGGKGERWGRVLVDRVQPPPTPYPCPPPPPTPHRRAVRPLIADCGKRREADWVLPRTNNRRWWPGGLSAFHVLLVLAADTMRPLARDDEVQRGPPGPSPSARCLWRLTCVKREH